MGLGESGCRVVKLHLIAVARAWWRRSSAVAAVGRSSAPVDCHLYAFGQGCSCRVQAQYTSRTAIAPFASGPGAEAKRTGWQPVVASDIGSGGAADGLVHAVKCCCCCAAKGRHLLAEQSGGLGVAASTSMFVASRHLLGIFLGIRANSRRRCLCGCRRLHS